MTDPLLAGLLGLLIGIVIGAGGVIALVWWAFSDQATRVRGHWRGRR